LIENVELKEILILQSHLINNLKTKFGDEVKNKRIYKIPEHQDLTLIALKMMKTQLNGICTLDTVLELECCCISSSILDLICATLLDCFQSVWTRQKWGLESPRILR
jgi:hypothetical protein